MLNVREASLTPVVAESATARGTTATPNVCIHTREHARVYARMCARTHTRVHARAHARMHAGCSWIILAPADEYIVLYFEVRLRACVRARACAFVHASVHACVCLSACVCEYTHAHGCAYTLVCTLRPASMALRNMLMQAYVCWRVCAFACAHSHMRKNDRMLHAPYTLAGVFVWRRTAYSKLPLILHISVLCPRTCLCTCRCTCLYT